MRATTCTLWPDAKARPGIMASEGASETICGKRLSRRFTASGGPGCAGSRTKTNRGEASTAAASAGATCTFTRTTAPGFGADGCGADAALAGATPPPSWPSMAVICCSMSGRTFGGGSIPRSFTKRARASAKSPRRAATAPPKNSALPESGASASARSMSRPARPLSSDSSVSTSASASPVSASAFWPPLRRSARSKARSASGYSCSAM